jgi:hypothetical protein
MPQWHLLLDTALYKENRYDGLMICGVNSAGEVDDSLPTRDVIGESFFSDDGGHGRCDGPGRGYRPRIVRWFELFGHPLATQAPGAFERSILQTNWRYDQSPTAKGRDTPAALAEHWENFAHHVEVLQPKLIMFMGVRLLEALNSSTCLPRARQLLGERVSDGSPWEHRTLRNGKVGPASAGFQQWERLSIVALPHPSRRIWSDEYIASFKDRISPMIAAYKSERKFS